MRKGYYIYFGAQDSSGVNKKIEMQVREMDKFFRVDTIEVPKIPRNFFKKILGLMPWISNNYDYDMLLVKLKDPDFIYIRTVLADKKYVAFLRDVRRKYPECRIMIEYPTFPYEREHLKIGEIFFLLKDVIYRKKLNPYVNRFVTYSQDEKIWGVPTIKVVNGIDVEAVSPVTPHNHGSEIHLIAVASFQKSHGYERCLMGLAEYDKYNKRRVVLHFVGDGTELIYYKGLVKKFALEKVVIFHGKRLGEELDAIYNLADIALGIFGLYKVKVYNSSALKIREYLAKGLPVVSGCNEDAFNNEKKDFLLQFPNNNSVIDINKVVQFYEDIYECGVSREDVHNNIRLYAKENIDMSVVLQPVIKYINE